MFGRMLCFLGLHRVVTTREGSEKRPLAGKVTTQAAAKFIHALCYRPHCSFHVIIDTHSGHKDIVDSPHAA